MKLGEAKPHVLSRYEIQEPRAPTSKRENNSANAVKEEQAAVNNKKETGRGMLIAVDVHRHVIT